MSRSAYKTVSNAPVDFIPSSMRGDTSLSLDAPAIKDRPMVVVCRKLRREERINLRSLVETKENREGLLEATNVGTALRFIWETCVIEVRNVLLDVGEFEVVKGTQKNALFDTEGIDAEIFEAIAFIQEISGLTAQESKT